MLSEQQTQTLEQLSAAATQERLTDGGRYFKGTGEDLTRCGHGDTGEYVNKHDGKFIEALWNAYRTGQLVAVQPDDATVERVKDAIGTSLAYDIGMDVRAGSLTNDEKRKLARKAIAAMIDKEATMEGVGG
jgi:hypothetical protein